MTTEVKAKQVHHKRLNDLKWCCHCKQYLPIDQFYHDRAKKDGLHDACKKCRLPNDKNYQHRYYLAHRDKLLPKHRISAVESYRRRKNEH